ncbi:MAG: DUF1284 domain-containing protein [Planctomycetota bacterium]|nr:DUF1284 domain-containing protein [Planctomycetota bacterium]
MTEPITLRAHQVLCLQGYRGEGYSVTFVTEMSRVHRELAEDPERPVRLITSPDRLCQACVHLRHGGCTLGGADHEAHMRRQDLEVLRRLGLEAGAVHPWRTIRERIAASVSGDDLPTICTTCPWLHLGWCAQGVDRLRGDPTTAYSTT